MTPDLDPTNVDSTTLAAGIFALVMCGLVFFALGLALCSAAMRFF